MAPRRSDVTDQPPTKLRAQRKEKKMWEEHKEKIVELYRDSDLENVMRKMSEEHGFKAK